MILFLFIGIAIIIIGNSAGWNTAVIIVITCIWMFFSNIFIVVYYILRIRQTRKRFENVNNDIIVLEDEFVDDQFELKMEKMKSKNWKGRFKDAFSNLTSVDF